MTTNTSSKIESSSNIVSLDKVSDKDFRFLYQLLKERDSKINISHRKMPSYDEHIHFILSNPYSAWYIIKLKNKKTGSIYLSKQNEVGIFIKKEYQNLHLGGISLKLLTRKHKRKRYLANVNPRNKKSINFFKTNGFNLIQNTYEKLEENNEK